MYLMDKENIFDDQPPVLSSRLFFLILLFQVFNNQYFHVFGPFSLGELLSLLTLIVLILVSLRSRVINIPFLGHLSLAAFFTYWFFSAIAIFRSPVPALSVKFLATVTFQVFIITTMIFFLRPKDVPHILKWVGLSAAFLGLINFLNSLPGGYDIFQARQINSRSLFNIFFPFERVVSFTNIFGQLGAFLLFGLFYLVGYFFWIKRNVFELSSFRFFFPMIFLVLGLVVLQSRATVVGFLIGFVIFAFFMASRLWRFFIILLSGVFATLFMGQVIRFFLSAYEVFVELQVSTVETRLSGYIDAVELIVKNPLGVGQGGFGLITGNEAVLHQTFLDAFLSAGWGGGIALCLAVLIPFFALLKNAIAHDALASGFLSAYISVLCVLSFYNGLTEYFFWLLIPFSIGLRSFIDMNILYLVNDKKVI